MNHIRLVRRPSGRYSLVTAFLGNPLNRIDLAAAGIEADPQDLSEAEAKRVGAMMDRWIYGQNSQAKKAVKMGQMDGQNEPQNKLRI